MLFKLNKFANFRQIAQGSLWVSGAMYFRVLAQGLVFLIIVRVLSVEEYGAYSAILALAGAIGGLGGLGVQTILVRDIARQPAEFEEAWCHLVAVLVFSSPLLMAVYYFLSVLVLPDSVSPLPIILIGFAEVVCMPAIIAAISVYQGYEKMGKTSHLMVAPIIPRFVGALILILFMFLFPPEYLLNAWTLLYATAAALAAAYGLLMVHREFGISHMPPWGVPWRKILEGIPFALSNGSMRLYTDADKSLLARLDTLSSAGAYSAAYRIVDMATVPVQSLLIAASPRFFREGAAGVRNAFVYVAKILPVPLLITVVISFSIFFLADFLPLLLGGSYDAAVPALRWLAWMPIVLLFRMCLQSLLGVSGHQKKALIIIALGALLNIGLNLCFIPIYGWHGAVITTYLVEMLSIILMLCIVASGATGRKRFESI